MIPRKKQISETVINICFTYKTTLEEVSSFSTKTLGPTWNIQNFKRKVKPRTHCLGVSIIEFKQVNAGWVMMCS